MSEQSILRRPALLTIGGIATISILYLVYRSHHVGTETEHNALRRTGAVRRPRRRWRPGHRPRQVPSDPVAHALANLDARIADDEPYHSYTNEALLPPESPLYQTANLGLLPGNAQNILELVQGSAQLSETLLKILGLHIEAMLVQHFLQEEFERGYIIGDDAHTLAQGLAARGMHVETALMVIDQFDRGEAPTPMNWDLREDFTPEGALQTEAERPADVLNTQDALAALRGSDAGTSRERQRQPSADQEKDSDGSQPMLDLLYHISAEQARKDGFVHRGIQCNVCGTQPIRGIRYHCSNCFDYDICEACEAQQVHIKTHIFYKIRIPAPSQGNLKQVASVWYPGKPNAVPDMLDKNLAAKLAKDNGVERPEIDSYYEQFRCLAGHNMAIHADPARLGLAIDRKNFDVYFNTTESGRPGPQNLLYDRIFSFYDQNNDDLITFDEFVAGMTNLQNRTRGAQVKRIFEAYDLDGDGYVDRRDFLRMFRAYYAWHKERGRTLIQYRREMDDDIRDAVASSQPLNAAFGGGRGIVSHASRAGQDKQPGTNGDLHISAGPNGVLAEDTDLSGVRERALGNAAVRDQRHSHVFRTFAEEDVADEPVFHLPPTQAWRLHSITHEDDATSEDLASPNVPYQAYGWPPLFAVRPEDVVAALGADLPLEEITDTNDRARVIYAQSRRLGEESEAVYGDIRQHAINQRWQRRQFYLDEDEGMTKPVGYRDADSSDEEGINEDDDDAHDRSGPIAPSAMSSRRQSMRSRSSSKVRFDDSAIDTDYETRSNASSRSMPLNERWGGFELGEAEKDIGKEMIYQAVQQGFNELLDALFKEHEDEAMEVQATRKVWLRWSKEIDEYEERILAGLVKKYGTDLDVPDQWMGTGGNDDERGAGNPRADRLGLDGSPPETRVQDVAADRRPIRGEAIDRTLPQHLPNAPGFVPWKGVSIEDMEAEDDINDDLTITFDPDGKPSDATLEKWLRYRIVDTEAEERQGYGKLAFWQFKEKLLPETAADVDEILAGKSSDGAKARNSKDAAGKPGGLFERYKFLGSWLEMSQF